MSLKEGVPGRGNIKGRTVEARHVHCVLFVCLFVCFKELHLCVKPELAGDQ